MSTPSLVYFPLLALASFGGASASPFRRFLHHPLDSFPPSTSPQTLLPPFFPSTTVTSPPPIPPPPPPPSPYLTTFPANISALLLPTSPSSSNLSSSHHRLASVFASVTLLSVALLFALSALILIRRRNRNAAGFSSKKSSHAEGLHLVPPNTCSSSDAVPLPLAASTSSSSEFLNPGAHSSSNHYVDVAQEAATAGVHSSISARTSYQKLSSPELRPLPPLPRVPTNWSGETISFYNKNEGTKKEEDRDDNGEDEFFSARGSSSHRGSTGSPDLRPALNPLRGSELLSRFRSRSLNSRNSSYPDTAAMYVSSQNSTSSSGGNAASLQMDSGSLEPVLKFLAPTNVSVSWAMPLNSPTLSSSTSSSQSHSETHKFKTFSPTAPIIHPATNLPPQGFWENPISQDPIAWLPGALAGAPLEQRRSSSSEISEGTPRAKLKPFYRDKVRATSDRTIVGDNIKLNEEMIETLVVANGSAQKEDGRQLELPLLNQENQVLDPKKSQNIMVLLKALNVTVDEVCESLMEGNVDSMGSELLESLSKITPTKEEERNLVEFNDESPMNLGSTEMFLKALLDVPFAFKRVDAMLYIANFNAETEYLRRSFETIKAACGELRNSKLFLKLLEAVLKTGNRMNVETNRGNDRAFKLDTLLKLVDVKVKDGRTTLLHFLVQEISRIEGTELSKDNERTNQSSLGLQVVSELIGDLTNVKKAASMDSCLLSNKVAKLADGLMRIKGVLRMCCDERNDDRGSKFTGSMRKFILQADEEIAYVLAEERAALSLVREATEYFHGDSGKEESHPFRIFFIVQDFLAILDRVCKELGRIDEASIYSSAIQFPTSASPSVQPLCPGLGEGREIPSRADDADSDCLHVTELGY